MKNTVLFGFFILVCSPLMRAQITCPSSTDAGVADYFLTNPYYAVCTDYASAENGSKLAGTDYVDFNSGSKVTFTDINMSAAGKYTLNLQYKIGYADANGAKLEVFVNSVSKGQIVLHKGDGNGPWTYPLSLTLTAGANTVQFKEMKDWPTLYSIQLSATTCGESSVDDYWISHVYPAVCTDYSDAGNGSKLAGNPDFVDFNWHSSISFTGIRVSQSANYKVKVHYLQSCNVLDIYVNNTLKAQPALAQNGEYSFVAPLLTGQDNVIKFTQNDGWLLTGGISLTYDSEIITTGISIVRQPDIQMHIAGNSLYLNTPDSETVKVYSVTGVLISTAEKCTGEIIIPLNNTNRQVLIVKGSSGWANKIVK